MPPKHLLYRLKRKGTILTMTLKGVNKTPAKRGACSHYSTFSRKRLSDLLSSLHFSMTDFVTLTYYGEVGIEQAKRNLKTFFQLARIKYPRLRYLWAQEFQARGVVHFHVLVDVKLPTKTCLVGESYRQVLDTTWWPYGSAIVVPVDNDGGLSKYLCDDISKENQRAGHYFVGRWWGCSRGLVPVGEWVVDSGIADFARGCGVGDPCRKWKGNLHYKKTFDILNPLLLQFPCSKNLGIVRLKKNG